MLSNITPKRHALLNGKIITQGVGYLPMSYWSWRHQKSSKYHRLWLLLLVTLDNYLGKTLLLKTTFSLVVEHREINLKSIKKSPPCSLDFIVLEGTLQDTRGENNGLNQCWSLKSGLSLCQTRKTHLLKQYWYKCYGGNKSHLYWIWSLFQRTPFC